MLKVSKTTEDSDGHALVSVSMLTDDQTYNVTSAWVLHAGMKSLATDGARRALAIADFLGFD